MNSGSGWKTGSKIFLVNPNLVTMGFATITSRWMYVIAAATPDRFGRPVIVDEALRPFNLDTIEQGDVVGIGSYTANIHNAYALGRKAKERGAFVVYGGSHPSAVPEEALDARYGHGDAVVVGDGDIAWGELLRDYANGCPKEIYKTGTGRIPAEDFVPADWSFLERGRYCIPSVQTVRGCPEECTFCSVWTQDGRVPRHRSADAVMKELTELYRLGFRLVFLADDNFNPATAKRIRESGDLPAARREELIFQRRERFRLMAMMAALPKDMYFGTQITMDTADEPDFLEAMRKARIASVLVGVETVSRAGLTELKKNFNADGEALVAKLRRFQEHGIGVLASCIFGLESDQPESFGDTLEVLKKAKVPFAQFIPKRVYLATVEFWKLEKRLKAENGGVLPLVPGTEVPVSRTWLLPPDEKPAWAFNINETMEWSEIRSRTAKAWRDFYRLATIIRRARSFPIPWPYLFRFVALSITFYKFYSRSGTGISSDAVRYTPIPWPVRQLLRLCRVFFVGKPMPGLQVPGLPSGYQDPDFVVDPVEPARSEVVPESQLAIIGSKGD